MDRRRANPLRPATSEGNIPTPTRTRLNLPVDLNFLEEIDCWSQASVSLNKIQEMYANPGPAETIGRVNRLISVWPNDDTLPAEGYDGLKVVYKKLQSGLREIQNQADSEVA